MTLWEHGGYEAANKPGTLSDAIAVIDEVVDAIDAATLKAFGRLRGRPARDKLQAVRKILDDLHQEAPVAFMLKSENDNDRAYFYQDPNTASLLARSRSAEGNECEIFPLVVQR